jgi:hypothetical protein
LRATLLRLPDLAHNVVALLCSNTSAIEAQQTLARRQPGRFMSSQPSVWAWCRLRLGLFPCLTGRFGQVFQRCVECVLRIIRPDLFAASRNFSAWDFFPVMFDLGRAIRKIRKAVRARLAFLRGGLEALIHLRDWAEHQKTRAAEIEEKTKDLFEGSEDRALYLVVGTALTSWATMEESMVIIFSMLLRTDAEKAGLILYSIVNFSVWINIIDELFAIDDLYFPLKPRWNKLVERFRPLKDDRDRIAHHAVRPKREGASKFAETTLRPSGFDIRRKSLKHKPMADDDIMAFTTKVNSLARDLINFAEAMTQQPSPGKSAERDRDLHLPVGSR